MRINLVTTMGIIAYGSQQAFRQALGTRVASVLVDYIRHIVNLLWKITSTMDQCLL